LISHECVGQSIAPIVRAYGPDEVRAYARAIAGAVFEQPPLCVEDLPGLVTVLRHPALEAALAVVGASGAPVHVEEEVALHGPLAETGEIILRATISALYDLIVHAMVEVRTTVQSSAGVLIAVMTTRALIPNAGDFDGASPPRAVRPAPKGPPVFTLRASTTDNQAQLFGACGDNNRLHLDHDVATAAGYPRPPLQGLCTAGIILRVVMQALQRWTGLPMTDFFLRFVQPVFPGEELEIEGYLTGESDRLLVHAAAAERGRRVLIADIGFSKPLSGAASTVAR